MSTAEIPSQVQITERGERIIDCPPGIEEQLRQAAFEEVSTNVFVKKRKSVNSESAQSEYTVVKAYLKDDQLTISAKDVVGIVDLTPTSQLQIKPKIGWSEILEMFLTVQQYNRTPRYHGVPITDFLSDDVNIEDVFLFIATNYLNSLEPIYRYGFIRNLETRRVDAVDGRGRIDVERSLLNINSGIPKHHYVQKVANYNTPINALIHCAGKQLLQLFQKHTKKHTHKEYFRIFSELYDAVHDLEKRGIDGSNRHLSTYREITSSNLPRQRSYYKRAIEVSKMVLSSSIGQSLESGRENLTMDYLFNMESLFEEFSQIILEEEVKKIQSNPLYSGIDNIRVKSKPLLHPYVDTNDARHQPDHVLYKGNEAIAVLDSKYYDKENDPSMTRSLRSQLFSYAFLLNVDKMAFLLPESAKGSKRRHKLRDREGEVVNVSSHSSFTTDQYREAIHDYLRDLLEERIKDSQFVIDVRERNICYESISEDSIRTLLEMDELSPTNSSLHWKIFNESVRLSSKVRQRRLIPRSIIFNIKNDIKDNMNNNKNYDRCIPIFLPADINSEDTDTSQNENIENGELIRLYFVRLNNTKDVKAIKMVDQPLSWKE